MATKSGPDLIDDLLRQDEAELRAKKKRLRWWVSLGFVAAAAVLFGYGWYIFTMMSGAG